MGFLLAPKEKVLARKFCELILHTGLTHSDRIVFLVTQGYLERLYAKGDSKLAKAIEEHLKYCNPTLAKTLSLK